MKCVSLGKRVGMKIGDNITSVMNLIKIKFKLETVFFGLFWRVHKHGLDGTQLLVMESLVNSLRAISSY